MKKEILHEDLFVIHNFLDNQTFFYLQEFIKNDSGWEKNSKETDIKNPLFYKLIPKEFSLLLHHEFNKFCKNDEYVPFLQQIRKYNIGNKMSLHADGSDDILINKNQNITKERKAITGGFVLYLNDNFSGGEINYPNIGITYKPVANDLVYHPSTYKYAHEVLEIKEGTRFVITSFFRKKS
jgi:Rps23 Pro-64 3,4-dihydroxylase Tpa1-like proline 4-hydroxylase